MKYPKSFTQLMDSFQKYPGIGPKSSERLAFFTALKMKPEDVHRFKESLEAVLNEVKPCSNCGMITDQDRCDVCMDTTREQMIVVVETTKDAFVLERTNQYRGKYHILNGVISPLNGISPEDINVSSLLSRIEKEQILEVILATGATVEGEMTALYIHNLMQKKGIQVSRIGYGLPAGGDIEYADEITLIKALEGRRKM